MAWVQSAYYDVKTSAHTVFKIVMRSPIYLVARRMYIQGHKAESKYQVQRKVRELVVRVLFLGLSFFALSVRQSCVLACMSDENQRQLN